MPPAFITSRTLKPRRLIETRRLLCSIRTLASSPLRLLMSLVPMFPVYVNFTLHVNFQRLYLFG